MPWLDELVALSVDGHYRERFDRIQALWHAVIDQIAPFIPHLAGSDLTAPAGTDQTGPTSGSPVHATTGRSQTVRDALRSDIARNWGLPELASMVHLSTKQLSRVFVDAYGKTPLTYLTMLRVEEMARLLRETDLTIEQAGRQVGWRSRNRASAAFRECVGITTEPVPSDALREQQHAHE